MTSTPTGAKIWLDVDLPTLNKVHLLSLSHTEQGAASKDVPIIFSARMVQALLDGRKTMTRRLAWGKERLVQERDRAAIERSGHLFRRGDRGDCFAARPSPWQKVKPGDRLWVRENLRVGPETLLFSADGSTVPKGSFAWQDWYYRYGERQIPCIHMPRWASRLTVIVTAVKVERLQDISREDAIAEGCKVVRDHCFVFDGTGYDKAALCHSSPVTAFSCLWSELHGDESWDANPEVVALTFTVERTTR